MDREAVGTSGDGGVGGACTRWTATQFIYKYIRVLGTNNTEGVIARYGRIEVLCNYCTYILAKWPSAIRRYIRKEWRWLYKDLEKL